MTPPNRPTACPPSDDHERPVVMGDCAAPQSSRFGYALDTAVVDTAVVDNTEDLWNQTAAVAAPCALGARANPEAALRNAIGPRAGTGPARPTPDAKGTYLSAIDRIFNK